MIFEILSAYPWFTALFLGLAGACFGSFITLLTYRLPRDLPVVRARSICPHCETRLTPRDLVPVLSWVFFRGRCRHCTTRISGRYPLIEIIAGTICVGIYLWHGLSLLSLIEMSLLLCVLAHLVSDFEERLLLDEVQVMLFFLGLLYGMERGIPLEQLFLGGGVGLLIGASLKYGFLFATGRDGLGMGDVKLLVVAGLWLMAASHALTIFAPFLFYAGACGIITGVLWRWATGEPQFPFGPALLSSLLLCVFFPQFAVGFFNLYGLLPHSP
jgi:leader peptidase (prepilin peptidase)/N-methyltransferase